MTPTETALLALLKEDLRQIGQGVRWSTVLLAVIAAQLGINLVTP